MTYHLAQEQIAQSGNYINSAKYGWNNGYSGLNYFDYLSKKYLYATKELALICSEYKYILYTQTKLDLLLTKLTDLLNEASGGDWQAIKEVENKGTPTLRGALEILQGLSIKTNKYLCLERELQQFYKHYFVT